MVKDNTSCIRVSDTALCTNCKSKQIIKNGFTKTRKQQFYCKNCGNRFLDYYSYQACKATINNQIIALTKEGVGIRSTARLLHISTTTLLSRIISIAKAIQPPIIPIGKVFEVDEMRT
jgi:insertion element IS1 protein InsB